MTGGYATQQTQPTWEVCNPGLPKACPIVVAKHRLWCQYLAQQPQKQEAGRRGGESGAESGEGWGEEATATGGHNRCCAAPVVTSGCDNWQGWSGGKGGREALDNLHKLVQLIRGRGAARGRGEEAGGRGEGRARGAGGTGAGRRQQSAKACPRVLETLHHRDRLT